MQTALFNVGNLGTIEFLLIACIIAFLTVLSPLFWLALLCAQPHLLTAFTTAKGNSVALSLALVIIGASILTIKNPAKLQRLTYGLSVPIVILLGWASISFILYPALDYSSASSMSRMIIVGSLAPYVLIITHLRTFDDVHVFIGHVLLWLFIVQVLYFISVVLAVSGGLSIESVRSVAIAGVVLYFSHGGVTLILATSYLTWGGNIFTHVRWVLAAAGLLGFSLVVIDGSRTIIISALLAMLFIVWKRKKLATYLVGGIAGFLVLLLVISVTQPKILDALETTWEGRLAQSRSGDLSELSSGRDRLYNDLWNSFQRSPLVGVGLGNATEPRMYNGEWVRQNPHSFYFGTLGQQGIFGFSLIALIAVMSFYRIRALWRFTAAAPHERRLVLLVTTMLGYGAMCMAFKADNGITFWALALLEVLYQAARRTKVSRDTFAVRLQTILWRRLRTAN